LEKSEFVNWITRGFHSVSHRIETLYNYSIITNALAENKFPFDLEGFDSHLKVDNSYDYFSEIVCFFRTDMESCLLFVTEDDTIGIAPQNSQAGDVICIVQGAYTPCILRQIARDKWSLVSGDCYLCRHNSPFALSWNQEDFNRTKLWDYYKRKGIEEDFVIY
jgi:hypothetical protein